MNAKLLIEHLKKETQVLKSAVIEEAFIAIDRAAFVPPELVEEAYEDYALPIGYGQTISQPTTVVFMLELLGAQSGEKILDVGSGSCWTTALLAHIVGRNGRVWGTEIVPELVAYGSTNLAKFDLPNASNELAGPVFGKPAEAPFDRILVSAAAQLVPPELVAQLKIGGTMVIPIQDAIVEVTRDQSGHKERRHEGFVFVPLI